MGNSGVLPGTRSFGVDLLQALNFQQTPLPSKTLANSNLHCAGERHEGGRGPTQLALCRDTCINKPASNTHNSMEGTVGAFAIPCLPQRQLLPQLDTADLATLGSFPRSEFLKEKLHPAASSSLSPDLPLHQNPMPTLRMLHPSAQVCHT